MKLVVFVVSNAQADDVVEALLEKGHRVTRLASTGGFLRQGNTTLIVGAAEEAIAEIVATVKQRAAGTLAVVLPLERYERY